MDSFRARLAAADWGAVAQRQLASLARQLVPGRPQTHGSSRWAHAREAGRLGRRSVAGREWGDGIVLGRLGRHLLQTPAEDNLLLLGVQRSGKTSSVIVPTLLCWSGAVVATSTKEELVRLTARSRRRRGAVHVFAPLDPESSWITAEGAERARWNPLSTATDVSLAAELASHFTAAERSRALDHWHLAAANLLTALITLEASRGGDMRSVLGLLMRLSSPQYAALALGTQDETVRDLLLAHAQTPEREAASIASTARSCLSLWVDSRVALATSAGEERLDLDSLLALGGTLYLVAPAEEAERCRPLFSALLHTLLRTATARARRLGGVLAPRLLVALDEAANFARVPRLSGYASSGPGQGIQLLLGFHDLAQIELVYGREAARTIWNNCRARLLLPGQGDLGTLEQFSRSMGEETRVYGSAHRGRGVEQRLGHPLCSVDELRRMPSAVLIYAGAPPARLLTRRWDQVPAWREQVERPDPGDGSTSPVEGG
ncbi:MAG TPA: type IV secretory system conjugative DNA transfer family protein [Candidatus Nitrosotalea sp.]|nr:type IV secretory system conjugative DNA transfer family protein [Candidatus Nitrosotalea sp.]